MSLVLDEKEIDSIPITMDPEVLSGSPMFRGTRVPVDALTMGSIFNDLA